MSLKHAFIPILICVLMGSGSAGPNQVASNPGHTAVAMIEVLPYAQPDPLSLETPNIDVELQREFRRSKAMLMTQPDFFDRLVKREKVKGTTWFREIGGDLKRAAKDLRQRCAAEARKDSGFLEAVVACDDPNDSALIAEEMVNLFVELQEAGAKAKLDVRIKALDTRRRRILKAIEATETEIEVIYKRYGHADLDEHEYCHPAEARLIRVEERRDDLLLEIVEQDPTVTRLDSRSRSGSRSKVGSRIVQIKLLAAEKMYGEARKSKDDLDLARAAYKRAAAALTRHERMLEQVDLLIDKLQMMHDSPDVSRLRPIGPAWIIETP